jgi:hypothetical protein
MFNNKTICMNNREQLTESTTEYLNIVQIIPYDGQLINVQLYSKYYN